MALQGLATALAARKKYVDESSQITESVGVGSSKYSSEIALARFNFTPKSETGRVGLQNQGATCYLNSLIQALFMIPEFRRSLFSWHYDETLHGDSNRNLPFQLQRLFAELQISEKGAVATNALTKSFGWTGSEAFVQQDVQECMSVIFDFLITQCAGTFLGSHITQEHCGIFSDTLTCSLCWIPRSRIEDFRDISLPIRGCSSVEDCLRSFLVSEEIEGVWCENCKSPSLHFKGLKITKSPHFLFLHLKRFDLNYETLQRIKLNDEINIPLELNMTQFVSSPSLQDSNNDAPDQNNNEMRYELLSVLLHTGSAFAGHYFCYTKDLEQDGKWLIFNDSKVDEMSDQELERLLKQQTKQEPAQSNQISKSIEQPVPLPNNSTLPQVPPPLPLAIPPLPLVLSDSKDSNSLQLKDKNTSASKSLTNASKNAYLLIYRRIQSDNISFVPNDSIPSYQIESIKQENEEYLAQKAKWEDEQKYLNVKVNYKSQPYFVRIHEDRSVRELINILLEKIYQGKQEIPKRIENFRLRIWNPLRATAREPIENIDCPTKEISKHLSKGFTLEEKEDNEEFDEYIEGGLNLDLRILQDYGVNSKEGDDGDEKTKILQKGTIMIGIDETSNQISAKVAKKLGWDRAYLFILRDEKMFSVEEVKNNIAKYEPIKGGVEGKSIELQDGDRLYCCAHESEIQRLQNFFDEVFNSVSIEFRVETKEDEIRVINEEEVETLKQVIKIDQRKALFELKQKISARLNWSTEEFKIVQAGTRVEYKDLSKTVNESAIYDGVSLLIKPGIPLSPGQFDVQILFVINNAEISNPATISTEAAISNQQQQNQDAGSDKMWYSCLSLGRIVISQIEVVSELKQRLVTHFDQLKEKQPQQIRLREGSLSVTASTNIQETELKRVSLGNVLYDSSLIENCLHHLRDGLIIVVQETLENEHFTPDHILIHIARWFPSTLQIGNLYEVAVLGKSCISDFISETIVGLMQKEENASYSEGKEILICKPRKWQLKTTEAIPSLWRKPQAKKDATLSGSPLHLISGDVIIYKFFDEEEQPQYANISDHSVANKSSGEQGGFRIYSIEEQTQIEEQRKKEMDENKKIIDEQMKLMTSALQGIQSKHNTQN